MAHFLVKDHPAAHNATFPLTRCGVDVTTHRNLPQAGRMSMLCGSITQSLGGQLRLTTTQSRLCLSVTRRLLLISTRECRSDVGRWSGSTLTVGLLQARGKFRKPSRLSVNHFAAAKVFFVNLVRAVEHQEQSAVLPYPCKTSRSLVCSFA